MSHYRKITIRGEEWSWKYGNPILIHNPKGHSHKFPHRDEYYAITPRDIANMIDFKILGYDPRKGFPPGILPRGFSVSPQHDHHRINGPRGTWWVRVTPILTYFVSPEGVKFTVASNDMFGDDWTTNQIAALEQYGDEYPRLDRMTPNAFIDALRDLSHPRPNFKAIRSYIDQQYGTISHDVV